MSAGANGQMAIPPPCEVVTLVSAGVSTLRVPGNPQAIILAFTLPNGRQYQLPLDADGRRAVIKELGGGLQVFGPGDVPS